MHTALSIGQEKLITLIIPSNFIDFKIKLLLCTDLMRSRINKCHQVLFIAHCDCITVRRPGYVDIFTLSADNRGAFIRSNVPNSYLEWKRKFKFCSWYAESCLRFCLHWLYLIARVRLHANIIDQPNRYDRERLCL